MSASCRASSPSVWNATCPPSLVVSLVPRKLEMNNRTVCGGSSISPSFQPPAPSGIRPLRFNTMVAGFRLMTASVALRRASTMDTSQHLRAGDTQQTAASAGIGALVHLGVALGHSESVVEPLLEARVLVRLLPGRHLLEASHLPLRHGGLFGPACRS